MNWGRSHWISCQVLALWNVQVYILSPDSKTSENDVHEFLGMKFSQFSSGSQTRFSGLPRTLPTHRHSWIFYISAISCSLIYTSSHRVRIPHVPLITSLCFLHHSVNHDIQVMVRRHFSTNPQILEMVDPISLTSLKMTDEVSPRMKKSSAVVKR